MTTRVTTREALGEIVERLDERDLRQVLDFARFVSGRSERDAWHAVSLGGLERAYCDDEPVYTEADLHPESNK